VDYTSSSPSWGRFLVKDFLEQGVFLSWLQKKDEKWLCENVFRASTASTATATRELTVNQLVASFAILAKLPFKLSKFMENSISHNAVGKCCTALQSAKKSKLKEYLITGYSSDTRDKFNKFSLSATCISLGVLCGAKDISYHEEIEVSILNDFEASWFLAEIL